MFVGLTYESTTLNFGNFKEIGQSHLNAHKTEVKETLNAFMLDGGRIDGSEMQENWFPQIEADVFISHSHSDEDLALGIAGYLNQVFGLTTFIDSCVWGYSNELLRKIDDEFCWNEERGFYDYDKRNYSTSHIHMMLATALAKMIDNTECLMFLKTPSSISSKDVVKNRTMSPWIYHELATTRLVRKMSPDWHRGKMHLTKKFAEDSSDSIQKSLQVSYVTDLGHLHSFDDAELQRWALAYASDVRSNKDHSLDYLYRLKRIFPRPLEAIYG